jgi:hypothetical protein
MIERFHIAPPGVFNRQVRGRYLYSPLVVVRAAELSAHLRRR